MGARKRNQLAFERTVVALRKGGRLEPVDAALVALGRTLAAEVDERGEPVTAAWALLAVLKQLRGGPVAADDGFSELVTAMQAPMGDAPER